MKKIFTLIVSLSVIFLAGTSLAVSPIEFLQISPDARSSAMGESGTALADNVNVMYYNPAGLGNLKKIQVSFTHSLWIADFDFDFIAASINLKNIGTFGAFLDTIWLGSGLKSLDQLGNETGSPLSFGNTAFGVAYATPSLIKGKKLYAGACVKMFSGTLDKDSLSSLLFDAGLLWMGIMPNLNAGICCQNLAVLQPNSEPVDLNLRIGVNYELLISKTKDALLGLIPEMDFTTAYSRLNIGLEFVYMLVPQKIQVDVRTGYRTKSDLGILTALSFGAGIKFRNYSLDYSFDSYNELGSAHRFTLNFSI